MRKGRGTFLLKHRVLEFSMIVSKSLDRQEFVSLVQKQLLKSLD